MNKVNYDGQKDFVPVAIVATNPFVLGIYPAIGAKTLREFVDYVKARRGKLNYSSGGTGSVGLKMHPPVAVKHAPFLKNTLSGEEVDVGLIAAAQSYMGRLVVTLDEDVDPSNLADVMWAITTRCEPSESVDIIRNSWSSALDPRITTENRMRGQTSNSKMIIDAGMPFSWMNEFPKTSALSQDEARSLAEKWHASLRQ